MNIRIVFKFKDCKLQFYEKRRLVSYFGVNPCTPASRWRRLWWPSQNAIVFLSSFFFFSSATKWKNCAIVPSGHWAPNTTTTNCDPLKCSHADHACYIDDDWRCHARTGPGHMTSHGIFAYITLLSVALYFNVFGLRSPGASRCKRSKYLQTHAQVVLFAANPH